MNRIFILPALLALHRLGGCGPRTWTDPAETIRAKAGKPFRISVPHKPATGYRGHLVDSPAAASLVVVDSTKRMSRASRNRDGGAGRKYWTFRPSRAGTATVTLVNTAPSEFQGDTARFRVVIR